jgi:ABC-type nitrate/sulfonate/bicarbonate transport system substrate-binding protein
MLRRVLKCLCAAFTCTVIIGSPAGAAQMTPSPSLITLRVATSTNDEVTALLYAAQNGLFAKAGLDVRIDRQSNGSAVAAALLGGSYDIGKVSVTDLFNAHEKGLPLTIIGPAGIYDSRAPFAQLIVAKDSTIKSAKDLNGKIVGVDSLHGIGRVAVDIWMRKNGGDPQSVHYVEVPFSTVASAIRARRIDAGAILEPYLSAALRSGDFRAFPHYAAAITPVFLYTAWVADSTWAAKHSDAVRTFARVMAQSARYTNANPAKTAAMIAQYTSLPLTTIQHMIRATNGTTLSASELQPTINAAARAGVIRRAFPARELLDPDMIGEK